MTQKFNSKTFALSEKAAQLPHQEEKTLGLFSSHWAGVFQALCCGDYAVNAPKLGTTHYFLLTYRVDISTTSKLKIYGGTQFSTWQRLITGPLSWNERIARREARVLHRSPFSPSSFSDQDCVCDGGFPEDRQILS